MTHTLVDGLREDHHGLRALLGIIERQLQSLEGDRTPDFEVMADLLEFVNEQPQSHHHRCEQRLLTRIGELDPGCEALAGRIEAERGQVTTEGRRLHQIVTGALEGVIESREELVEVGRAFVRDYRALMAHEEAEAFPAIAEHLGPVPCRRIVARQAPKSTDVAESVAYTAIRDEVTCLAGDLWPPTAAPTTRCPVCDRE